MIKENQEILKKANMFFDAILIAVSFVIAYLIRDRLLSGYSPYENLLPFGEYAWVFIIAIPIGLFFLDSNGLYYTYRSISFGKLLLKLANAVAQMLAVIFTIVFLFKIPVVSRSLLALFGVLAMGILSAEKVLLKAGFNLLRSRGFNTRTILVVGTGTTARKLIDMLAEHSDWGYRVAGCLRGPADGSSRPEEVQSLRDVPVIGEIESLGEVLSRSQIDEVAFALPFHQQENMKRHLEICANEGVRARIIADYSMDSSTRTLIEDIEGLPMISFTDLSTSYWQVVVKQLVDTIGAFGLLILASPLMLLIAMAIKLTSRGPVLFKQTRVGLNKRIFNLYKFRTMVAGAENMRGGLEHLNEMDGPVFKIREDPRLTPLGKIIRKTSLDELPQLINVLKGEMSFIGPRPPLESETALYKPWQRRRLSMKPGITGIWQVSGRNEVDFENWVKMDLEYIDNWSLMLDFKIFLKTFPAIISGHGAF